MHLKANYCFYLAALQAQKSEKKSGSYDKSSDGKNRLCNQQLYGP